MGIYVIEARRSSNENLSVWRTSVYGSDVILLQESPHMVHSKSIDLRIW